MGLTEAPAIDQALAALTVRNLELQEALLMEQLAHAQFRVNVLIRDGKEMERDLGSVRMELAKLRPAPAKPSSAPAIKPPPGDLV